MTISGSDGNDATRHYPGPVGSENLTAAERLAALLTHLDIQRAHVAGGFAPNAATLAMYRPETVASLTLICPFRMPREPFMPAGVPLLMVYGINSLISVFRELAARFPDTRCLRQVSLPSTCGGR
jgi:pimeloyl-ACP methyl ester carboxylesterase